VGADPRNGLAATKWQHARKNCRRPRAPVLGPEARRVRGTEESRWPNSAGAETGLLYSKGFYWDEAILFPAGAHWQDAPASVFWNGPVVRIVPSLENSLNEVH